MPLTTHVKEAEFDQFFEELEDLLELTWKKNDVYSKLGIGMQN